MEDYILHVTKEKIKHVIRLDGQAKFRLENVFRECKNNHLCKYYLFNDFHIIEEKNK